MVFLFKEKITLKPLKIARSILNHLGLEQKTEMN